MKVRGVFEGLLFGQRVKIINYARIFDKREQRKKFKLTLCTITYRAVMCISGRHVVPALTE